MEDNKNTASAFKWRITNAKYIYITDEGIGEERYSLPFIYDMSGDTRIYSNGVESSGQPDEQTIKNATLELSESENAYAGQFEEMVALLSSDEAGRFLQLLDYSAYYKNIEGCSEGATTVTCNPIDVFFTAVTDRYPCGSQAEVYVSKTTDETSEGGGVKRTFELTFCIPEGQQGPQGYTGTQGPTGTQGALGTQGYIGVQGNRGTQGYRGTQGPQGAQGPIGGIYPVGEAGNSVKYNVIGYNDTEAPMVNKFSEVYYEKSQNENNNYFSIKAQGGDFTVYNRVYTLSLIIIDHNASYQRVFTYYNNYVREHISEYRSLYYFTYIESQTVGTPNSYGFYQYLAGDGPVLLGVAKENDEKTGAFFRFLHDVVRVAINSDEKTESSYTIGIGRFSDYLYEKLGGGFVQGITSTNLVVTCDSEIIEVVKPTLQVNNFKNIEVSPENSGTISTKVLDSRIGNTSTAYNQESGLIELKANGWQNSSLKISSTNVSLNTTTFNVTGNTNINGNVTGIVNNKSNVTLGVPIGSVMMWAGVGSAPDGWFLCNGVGIPIARNEETGYYYTIKCIIQGKDIEEDALHYFTFNILANNGIDNFGNGYYVRRNTNEWVSTIEPEYSSTTVKVLSFTNDINEAYKFSGEDIGKTFKYGSSTFTATSYTAYYLPDLVQKFPLGAGTAGSTITAGGITHNTGLGETGGEKEHKLSMLEIAPDGGGLLVSANPKDAGVVGWLRHSMADQAHNNIPQYLAMNFIIKYK